MRKFKKWAVINWDVSFIIALTLLLIIQNFSTKFYLIGWDNFSISLDPWLNLKRTIFITWREYRGLGTPSDSEIADISRQFTYLILNLLLPKNYLEQVFIYLNIFLGMLGVNLLFKTLSNTANKNIQQIGALISTVFYIFNLNTTATLYNPIVMYIARFGSLPLLIWAFIKAKNDPSRKNLKLLVIIAIFSGPSYLTATVFLTTASIIVLILIFCTKRKMQLKLILLIFLLNSYWLIPFINYTVEKATIIPIASTFIEVNEIQLNNNPSQFSFDKITKLQTEFPKAWILSSNEPISIHPINDTYESNPYKTILYLFPIAYLTGAVLIIAKRRVELYWIPVGIVTLIIFSRNYLEPFGAIYGLLATRIPLMEIVFRFPDTKVYPIIALLGSISAGFLISNVIQIINNSKLKVITLVTLIVLAAIPFNFYFQGLLINPMLKTEIPEQYFELAKYINSKKTYRRYIHLPNEKISYWKAYEWGYVGSSFLSFMVGNPILDRTFEPGSLENDKINQTIQNIANNATNSSQVDLEYKAKALYKILADSYIEGIIWDESVNPEVTSREMRYWGTYNSEDMAAVLKTMEKLGLISTEKKWTIDINTYLNKYPNVLNSPTTSENEMPQPNTADLVLYKVSSEKANMFNNIENAIVLEQTSKHELTPNLSIENYISTSQDFDNKTYMPFYSAQTELEEKDASIAFDMDDSYKFVNKEPQTYNDAVIDVYIRMNKSKNTLDIGISERNPFSNDDKPRLETSFILPNEKLKKIESPIAADWNILGENLSENYRLAIDGTILPMKADMNEEYILLASTFVENKTNFEISLLQKTTSKAVDFSGFNLTENPNCFNDLAVGKDFGGKVTKLENLLQIETSNGSTCIISTEAVPEGERYYSTEYLVSYEAVAKEERNEEILSTLQTKMENNQKITLQPLNYMDFCIVGTLGQNTNCLNNHQGVRLQSQGNVLIPQTRLQEVDGKSIVISAISIGTQETKIIFNNITRNTFEILETKSITLPENNIVTRKKEINEIPKVLSKESYFFNTKIDALLTFTKTCEEDLATRGTKFLQKTEDIVFFQENCDNGVSVKSIFSPNYFYLWQTNYNLLSGKFPKFKISLNSKDIKNEILSLETGYPHIRGFKEMQKSMVSKLPSDEIKNIIQKANLETAYTYLYPYATEKASQEILFTISQDSKNVGIVKLHGFNIMRLPKSWLNTKLQTETSSNINFASLKIHSEKKIIPALWKLKVSLRPQIQNGNKYLLRFNQGYDRQWVLLPLKNGTTNLTFEHIKLNNLVNGWIVDNVNSEEEVTLYAFYWPELLGIVGIIVSLVTFTAMMTKDNILRQR